MVGDRLNTSLLGPCCTLVHHEFLTGPSFQASRSKGEVFASVQDARRAGFNVHVKSDLSETCEK